MSIVFDIPTPIRSRSLGRAGAGRIFGAALLGIPLFQRGLVLGVSTLIVDGIDTETGATLYTWFGLIGLRLSVFLGARGTAVAPGHAPAGGWQYADNRRDRGTASS